MAETGELSGLALPQPRAALSRLAMPVFPAQDIADAANIPHGSGSSRPICRPPACPSGLPDNRSHPARSEHRLQCRQPTRCGAGAGRKPGPPCVPVVVMWRAVFRTPPRMASLPLLTVIGNLVHMRDGPDICSPVTARSIPARVGWPMNGAANGCACLPPRLTRPLPAGYTAPICRPEHTGPIRARPFSSKKTDKKIRIFLSRP